MKPIPNYEGLYSITDDGKLYSHRARRMIGGFLNKDGYACAVLSRNYERWYTGIHNLVALTWLDDLGEGFEVNHKNGNRLDNRAANLEWVTHRQNCSRERALFLMSSLPRGEKNGGCRYAREQIEMVRRLRADGLSGLKIAAETGISDSQVYRILGGKHWAHTSAS